MLRVFLYISMGLTILGPSAQAHPVTSTGQVAVMSYNQAFLQDHWVSYSVTQRWALAARAMRAFTPLGEMRFHGLQLDALVYRRNQSDSQSNLYAYLGGGHSDYHGASGFSGMWGLQADFETRSRFVMIKAESMRGAAGYELGLVQARLGLAPYEAEYKEIAAWLMMQAQWHPGMSVGRAFTPLLRLFYRSVLWETGVSFQGDWMLNLMVHF